MSGASGNIYFGLMEFSDMAFFMHFLRPGDLFLDIGSNVGTYTIISSKVCGAHTCAFEPDAGTRAMLDDNIRANRIDSLVSVAETALGSVDGQIAFTVGLGPMNRVATSIDLLQQNVEISRLDSALTGQHPVAAKLDVEGFELEVLRGGRNTLSDPSLLALEIETVAPEAAELLHRAGFERFYYDPFARLLSRAPNGLPWNNQLFLRNAEEIQRRLLEAPTREIYGILV